MTDEEALVRRVIDAHNRGGAEVWDRYDEFFDPDLEWMATTVGAMGDPEGAIYRGRDGVRRFYTERAEAFAGGTVEVISIEPAGEDALVVRARSTATGRTSGVQVDEEITLVYWLRGGKIARVRGFRSREEALATVDA
jgi:ketosteroid isomerase-like protein